MVTITGNTYPVKDKLKALGAKWNPDAKGWDVPDELADKAREIVSNAPVNTSATTKKSYNPKICKVCGCKEYRDSRGYVVNKIYRSGECRDCYEERKMGY